jgi:hypothetical protein
MEQQHRHTAVDDVAASTIMAAHRRDHQHELPGHNCHPHGVEVVYLGDRAVMVCHDCLTDTGFIPHREAEHLAEDHRVRTLSDAPARTAPRTAPVRASSDHEHAA